MEALDGDGRQAPLGESLRRVEPAGAVVARAVPAAQRLDSNSRAAMRCMDEVAVADVDADVAEPVEEDEVAGLQRSACHTLAAVGLRVARVGEGDAEVAVHVADEAGAVEA